MDRPANRNLIDALAQLLPPQQADEPIELWDVGEQGLAVETLADCLCEHYVPLSRADRERLTVLADNFGVSPRVMRALRWCPDSDAAEQPWQVVEDTDFAFDISVELETEISEGHPLYGKVLTPLLVCESCDDVLALVDRDESEQYTIVVVHPTWSRQAEEPPWPRSSLYTSSDEALDRFVHGMTQK